MGHAMADYHLQRKSKRSAENTEAWIFGSGTESLASALYLIRHAYLHPSKIHIIDKHLFSEKLWYPADNSSVGYDQFAACLPVSAGLPMRRLLAMVPSGKWAQEQSLLDEIETAETKRVLAAKSSHTCFLAQIGGSLKHIPTKSLNLSYRDRLTLVHFLFKREKNLIRSKINENFPETFFQSSFWAIWSAQFGFQPWHSAAEFKRSLRQYLHEFHGLSILSCVDITGYYQYQSLYLPVYSFLRSCGVDFHFGTEVKDIKLIDNDTRQSVTGFDLVQGNIELRKSLGDSDIVLVSVGSTTSGSTMGTNDSPPTRQSITADNMLDQNWSVWLDLANKHHGFGNPYNFCTRQPESTLESFTITTEDITFFDCLKALTQCSSTAGAFIYLGDSRWKINLCIPSQPVFSEQPRGVRVLWGFARLPGLEGNYVKKKMLCCSGSDIIDEILGHLNLPYHPPSSLTVTVPRAMPRMSALFLTRSLHDRPPIQPLPNVGLIGPFTELPGYTCADISYGIRTAQVAISRLMGLDEQIEPLKSKISTMSKVLFGR